MWLIDLLVLGTCAVFLARAAASAVETRLPQTPGGVAARSTKAAPAPVYTKQIDPILDRNIFCSGCPPIRQKPDDDKDKIVDTPPQKTGLPLALLAIMYAPPPHGFKWSVAIIRDTENKSVGAFAVGGHVHSAKVIEILETRVYIDNDGKTEFMDLFEPPASPNAATTSVVAQVAPAPGTDALTIEMERGIKLIKENQYEIQRQTLESVLGNMNLLSRSARIVPEIRDGKAAGFRLYSVRPDGPFAKIGMQNGDVISAINGLEITSPEKALEVYSKLKSASHLSVGLERNGQRITKDYTIR